MVGTNVSAPHPNSNLLDSTDVVKGELKILRQQSGKLATGLGDPGFCVNDDVHRIRRQEIRRLVI
ncbi:uncharacterized protein LACBIDRAFT_310859 [Laccaria bicolor S238N-H82]|uniref:Predicted protein n=1 Tax=Laccaria bicolor (strain S238N-H82 / ATCC MYA-4686) TaxID=486041 RepID=B0DV93_LACBS|nr:uncharacterized protein LACBIDRAFT_310859 [Laccaria bicolor S238N-H82]EDR01538.1 predicted protein [Laccaria bicolor S238N-H82]|eukprot:XP_001887890.1 predicted protein [Laccaria bicolor S238N-H82]